MADIELVDFTPERLAAIYQKGFTELEPEWSRWDAPYFQEYVAYPSLTDFLASDTARFLASESCRCLCVAGCPLGMVSRYWVDQATRWMELGITIYDARDWKRGYGSQALRLWTHQTFEQFPELEHLGMTTWSGNHRMMRLAEKIGYQQEACIRRVRYWQEVYYDSIKYGVVREEWMG